MNGMTRRSSRWALALLASSQGDPGDDKKLPKSPARVFRVRQSARDQAFTTAEEVLHLHSDEAVITECVKLIEPIATAWDDIAHKAAA